MVLQVLAVTEAMVATGITRALISVRLLDRLVVTAALVVLVAVLVTVATGVLVVLVRRAVTVLMV
jgi:hypothetical protein